MKKSLLAGAAAMMLAVNVPVTATAAEKPAELTATELSAVQNTNVNVPANVAYSAAVATLQTLGYVDIQASKDAGTVSGMTESKAKLIYNIFWGFGKKKYMQKASMLIEETGPSSALVRLNLHVMESKSRGIWGTSFTDGKLVRFRDPYAEFFTAYQAELARRSTTAPAVSAVSTAPSAATSN